MSGGEVLVWKKWSGRGVLEWLMSGMSLLCVVIVQLLWFALVCGDGLEV